MVFKRQALLCLHLIINKSFLTDYSRKVTIYLETEMQAVGLFRKLRYLRLVDPENQSNTKQWYIRILDSLQANAVIKISYNVTNELENSVMDI